MILRTVVLLCCTLLFTSCSDLPTGRLVRDQEVARDFRAVRIRPGYAYYLNGRKHVPIAIIALKEELELVSRFWNKLPDPENSLPGIIEAAGRQRNPSCNFFGALITTPEGEIAGYWYSKWELTSIRFPEPGKIIVFPPAEPSAGPCTRQRLYYNDD